MLATYGLQRQRRTLPWYADSSTQNNAISIVGNVAEGNQGNGVKFGNFPGSGNFLTTHLNAIGTSNFTLETFFNATAFESDPDLNMLFCIGGDAVYTSSIDLSFFSNATIYVSSGADSITSTATFSYNVWNHVAFVRNGTAITLYLNGVSIGSAISNTNISQTFTYIGANDAGNRYRPYNGKITGLRVVKGAALYTSNFIVPKTLPIAVNGTQLLLNFGASAVPTV